MLGLERQRAARVRGLFREDSIPDSGRSRALPRPVVKLALGYKHTCVVLDDGTARCWGDNFYGQLGNGDDGVADRVPQTPQGFGSTRAQSRTMLPAERSSPAPSVPTAWSCAGGEAATVSSGMEPFRLYLRPILTSPTISSD